MRMKTGSSGGKSSQEQPIRYHDLSIYTKKKRKNRLNPTPFIDTAISLVPRKNCVERI